MDKKKKNAIGISSERKISNVFIYHFLGKNFDFFIPTKFDQIYQ